MNSADTMFKAIAHPVRREIIALLSASDHSVKELTAAFEMTQPAISQHLRELREAKLVASERIGLEQQYRLTGGPLKIIFDWSSQYRRFFDPAGHAWAFVSDKGNTKARQKKGGQRHGR